MPFQGALNLNTTEKKRSPSQKSPSSLSQQDTKSPGSMSSKSPFSLSRQGTLRSSHRRKNSTAHSLNLNPGRRSPQQLSPSGRRSPVFLMYDGTRSPLDLLEQRKSPTSLFPERIRSPTGGCRSPVGFPDLGGNRSPTSTVHVQDQKTSTALFLGLDEGRRSPTVQIQGRRSPIGFSQGLITCIPIVTPTDKKSPMGPNTLHIPPITVSNPSETCAIIDKHSSKILDSIKIEKSPPSDSSFNTDHRPVSPTPLTEQQQQQQQRKETRSVMREILAFVRKPSKKASSRTGKFAAAFSRAEPNSATPLIRQSTFSSSPAASSRAAKSAVTKQLSEISFEPKMSLKLLNSKMSFKLRRSSDKNKDKKSSGDEMSDMESSDSKPEKVGSSSSDIPFELENVRFEKVGESYIKHDKIREETLEDASPSPVQIVALSKELEKCINQMTTEQQQQKSCSSDNDIVNKIKKHDQIAQFQRTHESETSVDSIKEEGVNLNNSESTTGSDSKFEQLKTTLEHLVLKPEPIYANLLDVICDDPNIATNADGENKQESTIQCPTFEIMPPSRRSSFDPPRSPYLENLRSPCDTDTELINLNRLDSAGDSFEMVDTDRNRESSFESRYPSSSHTSFDISRYQSTSYEDSFEIIDIDAQKSGGSGSDEKRSPFDIRKSSIELVDVDTFQKSGSSGRKSSLETHFDFEMPVATSTGSRLSTPRTRKQISEPNNKHQCFPTLGMKTHCSVPHRTRSPLSNQTSSNYSSHDSYDSSFDHSGKHQFHGGGSGASGTSGSSSVAGSHSVPGTANDIKSPFADPSRQHFPLLESATGGSETRRSFLCTDQRCASIFEPRPVRNTSPFLGSHLTSSSEFEPPSPRRAASASPKHTFTFRIVLKKVDSSPDAICPSSTTTSTERRRSKDRTDRIRRRDSRKKRFWETGKSF